MVAPKWKERTGTRKEKEDAKTKNRKAKSATAKKARQVEEVVGIFRWGRGCDDGYDDARMAVEIVFHRPRV